MYMNYLSAKECVRKYLADRFGGDLDFVIKDDESIETPFGWIFCYDSRMFVETGELIYALAGNAPIIFDNRDESIHITGSSRGIDFYVGEHLKNYKPRVI